MSAVRRLAAGEAPALAAIVRGLPEYPLPGWPPGNPAAIYAAAIRPIRGEP